MSVEHVSSRRGLLLLALPLGAAVLVAAVYLNGGSDVTLPALEAIERANRLLNDGKIAEARQLFEAEYKVNPKNIAAIRGLVACARDSGDDEAAAAMLRRWTELDAKNPVPWKMLATTLARLGSDMEALSAAQTALVLTPQDPALNDLVTRLLTDQTSRPGQSADFPQPMRPQDPSKGIPNREPDPLQHFPQPGKR